MPFLEWLTTPDGVPVLVGIIGVVGTILAVAATVITQVILARDVRRREQERLDLDRERFREEAAAAARARFENVKREAYLRYLNAVAEVNYFYQNFENADFDFLIGVRRYLQSYKAAYTEFDTATIEIRLTAPEIYDSTWELGELTTRNHQILVRRPFRKPDLQSGRHYELIRAVLRDMHASLGIDSPTAKSHN